MDREFIPISVPSITELEIDYVTRAVRSTWISSIGEYIDRFEKEFAAFCGARYGVALMNGTVAIQLALEVFGIGEGDEVIVPDLSFIATANAVLYVGAVPVFADIDPDTYCIDVPSMERLITPRTKAVIPVHMYGHPADMTAIMEVAAKHGLVVIEDAAEAHGATVNERPVGGLGHAGTFSFYGNKNITTGEGGMIVTNDEEAYHRARFLRDHAMSKEKKYWHPEKGYNFRMTNLQAALGCAQMERADELLAGRKNIYNCYASLLKDVKGVRLNQTAPWATNSYWLVTAEFPGYREKERDDLIAYLREKGIDSRPFFYPMSSMPYLKKYYHDGLRNSYSVSERGINLPTYFTLKEEQIEMICETLIETLG